MAPPETLLPISATFAPSPGASAVDGAPVVGCGSAAGAAAGAASLAPLGAAGTEPDVDREESHCSGAGERKRTAPLSSLTSMRPCSSEATVSPWAVIGKRRFLSAGLAAACGVWTTITSRQPPTGSAVNWRSTSGRTFG